MRTVLDLCVEVGFAEYRIEDRGPAGGANRQDPHVAMSREGPIFGQSGLDVGGG